MPAAPDNEQNQAESPVGGWREHTRGLLAVAMPRLSLGVRWLLESGRKNWLWLSAAIFCLVSGAGIIWLVSSRQNNIHPDGLTLEAALESLDNGAHDDARRLAKALRHSTRLPAPQRGGPCFVEGAALAYAADGALSAAARNEQFLLAAKHLQQARRHGFPPGRDGEGLLLLAKSLQQAGEYSKSLPVLNELKTASPALSGEADRLLTTAYLRLTLPQLDQAQAHCAVFLNSSFAVSAEDRHRGWLLQAEIALLKDDFAGSAKALAEIPETSPLRPEALVMQGRLLLAEAAHAPSSDPTDDGATAPHNADYRPAIEAFRQAVALAPHHPRAAPQAAYFVGVALRHSGQFTAARDQFTATAKRHHDTPEGLLAGLEAAELMLELGEPEAARQALVGTIRSAGPPAQYANRWIPLEELRERAEAVNTRLLALDRYDLAVQLSFALPPLLPAERALELRALAHERWAQHLDHQAEQSPLSERGKRFSEARRHYRQAGVDFARLAHLHYTQRSYPSELWQSGRNFARGRDFQSAITLLRAYLETEADNHRPLAMVTLGQALLSRGEAAAAAEILEDCLRDYAKDPASYQARLTASQAYLEQNDVDRAEQLLRDNLHHESLTPRSDAWRASLFALGSLLYDDGRGRMIKHELEHDLTASTTHSVTGLELGHQRLLDAVRQLSEAVARYPDDAAAIQAYYQIASAHRHAARLPLRKLETETIESRRLALNRQAKDHLTDALQAYDRLLARVMQQPDEGASSKVDAAIVRNAYFARGAVLYDLGRYEDAIAAYAAATTRYQNEPASIEAYVQIAACYRRLNRPLEARGTLEQAKLVLERIDQSTDFSATSRFDRNEWIDHLNWMATL